MLRTIPLLALAALALLLAACGPAAAPARPGVITIERVELIQLESNPVQVQARITGYLGDGCTSFAGVSQTRDGSTITITLSATHSGGEACPAIAQLIDETVTIAGGFAPGSYTVLVNGAAYELTV